MSFRKNGIASFLIKSDTSYGSSVLNVPANGSRIGTGSILGGSGCRSFLGDRGRQRLLNMRKNNQEDDIEDDNFDGAPIVEEADSMDDEDLDFDEQMNQPM